MKDKDTHAVYPPNEDDTAEGRRATLYVVLLVAFFVVAILVCAFGAPH